MSHNFKAYAPADKRIRKMAALITDQETLDRVLNGCSTPALRAAVAEKIYPYLGFVPEALTSEATASVFGDEIPDEADDPDPEAYTAKR